MRNLAGFSRSRRALGLVAATALAVAVSSLPAGIGNLGRTNTVTSGGGTKTDLSYNPDYHVNFGTGVNVTAARDNLVTAINSDANFNTQFVAAAVTDPTDPNLVSFSVLRVGGADIAHMNLCENDPNVDNLGVSLADGRTVASMNRVTSFSPSGTTLTLSITTLSHGTFPRTFTNGSCPTFAICLPGADGLNLQIITYYTSQGFVAKDDGTNLTFRFPGDRISAIRVSSDDPGVVTTCLDLDSPASVPATGPIAMFLLVVVLTGSAIWMLKRSAKEHLTRP